MIETMTPCSIKSRNLTGCKPGQPRPLATRKNARMALFANLWTGSIAGTVKLCRAEGMAICEDTAASYLRDPWFVDLLREGKAAKPGSGVWAREELQRFLTRVAAGIEADGQTFTITAEIILPGEADYDAAKGGARYHKVEREAPAYPKMSDRLKAADLLGRSLGAFMDKVELTGDMQVSVTDLLDDDLKHAKQVVEHGSEELTAIADKSGA